MDVLTSMLTGVLLRLIFRSNSNTAIDAISLPLLGLWEANLFHRFLSSSLAPLDHYLAYAIRLLIGFFLDQSTLKLVLTVFWTVFAFFLIQFIAADHPSPRHRRHKSVRRSRTAAHSVPPHGPRLEPLLHPLPSIIPSGPPTPLPEPSPPRPAKVTRSPTTEPHAANVPSRPYPSNSFHNLAMDRIIFNDKLSPVLEEPSVEEETPLPVRLGMDSSPVLATNGRTAPSNGDMSSVNSDNVSAPPLPTSNKPQSVLSPLTTDHHKGFNGIDNANATRFHIFPDHQPNSSMLSQTPSDESSAGQAHSPLSRADRLRDKAREEDQHRESLRQQYQDALSKSEAKEAFLLKAQMEISQENSRKMHQKAALQHYSARNTSQKHAEKTIDVHGLRPSEALKVTEDALRKELAEGGCSLRVIVGKGLHSRGGIPVLKQNIARTMQEQQIRCEEDETNPGVLILSFPP